MKGSNDIVLVMMWSNMNSFKKKKERNLILYMAVPGLNCTTQDLNLRCGTWNLYLLQAACRI